MRRVVALLLVGLVAGPTARADGPAGPTVAEDVIGDVTWKGTVRLDGRVHVRAGATLRIAPGTKVVVVPVEAASRDPSLRYVPGIEVEGSLVAEGASDAPITFVPEASGSADAAKDVSSPLWLGLLVPPPTSDAQGPAPGAVVLSRCVLERALAGVQAGRTDVSLRSCVFHRCAAGVVVGVAWDSDTRFIALSGDVAPRLFDCRFGSCKIGVGVEGRGRPEIERCLFASCRLALGNDGPFRYVYPIHGLGPRAERCEFLRCGTAVFGTSYATNSVFEGNDLVFSASEFHDVVTTEIDRFLRAGNLYGPAQVFTRSDVPLGDGAVLGTPVRRGRLPDPPPLDLLGGDLEPVLSLTEGSPGHGAATDGGDVGMFGSVGAKRPDLALEDQGAGLPIVAWLIGGPAPSASRDDLAALAKSVGGHARGAGDLDGSVQWAAVPGVQLSDPAQAARLTGGASAPRLLCAVLASGREGGCALRLAWDGVLQAYWNGRPLVLPEGPRRFLPDDATVNLSRAKGDNVLLLRHAPRSTSARLSVRFVELIRGESAPSDFVIAPLSREATPASVAPTIRSASWQKPRQVPLQPPVTPYLRIAFSAPVHWCDASAPRAYSIADAAGHPVDLLGATVLYRPKESASDLAPSLPLPRGTYTVTVSNVRSPDGSSPTSPSSATFKVP